MKKKELFKDLSDKQAEKVVGGGVVARLLVGPVGRDLLSGCGRRLAVSSA